MNNYTLAQSATLAPEILRRAALETILINSDKATEAFLFPFQRFAILASPHGPAFQALMTGYLRNVLDIHPCPPADQRLRLCHLILIITVTLHEAWTRYAAPERFHFATSDVFADREDLLQHLSRALRSAAPLIPPGFAKAAVPAAVSCLPALINAGHPVALCEGEAPAIVVLPNNGRLPTKTLPQDVSVRPWNLVLANAPGLTGETPEDPEHLSLRLYASLALAMDHIDQRIPLEAFAHALWRLARQPSGFSDYLRARSSPPRGFLH